MSKGMLLAFSCQMLAKNGIHSIFIRIKAFFTGCLCNNEAFAIKTKLFPLF